MLPRKVNDWLARRQDRRKPLAELEKDLRRRMFWFGFAFALAIAPVQLSIAALYENKAVMWTGMAVFYGSTLCTAAWARRTKNYTTALRWLHSSAFVGTLIPCMSNVSVTTPSFWWLSVIPAVVLLCGLTTTGITMVLTVLAYAGFAYANPHLSREISAEPLRLHTAVALSTLYISTYLTLAMLWQRKLKLALISAQAEAMAAATAKARFLASMSHEIRTPLYGVIGAVELLRSGKATGAQRNQLLAMQEQSAKSLLALINDVLDWSKLEAGKVELCSEPLDLRSVIFDANELYAVSAFQKGLEITSSCDPDVPAMVLSDGVRIRQIINNLVSNAVKFTRHGGVHIHLSVHDAGAENNTVCWIQVDVSDTGIGIPEEQLSALFAPFAQADSSVTRKFGGTGLGLSICRELAELMGGRVAVRSSPNNGSTFTLVLPTTAMPEEARPIHSSRRNDVLVACATAGLVRHILSLAYDLDVAPEVVSHLPEEAETRGFKYLLVDAGLLAGHPRTKDWIDKMVKSGLKVAVMAPLNGDAMFGTFADGVLYKPVGKLALSTFLRGDAGPGSRDTGAPRINGSRVAGMRVLVCEDNPVNQIIVQHMLEEVGVKCVVAANGYEALELLQAESFDLVLMDVEMPDMDGLEATRRWRSKESARTTAMGRMPIIAMTANAESEHNAAARGAGMDGFLPKPFLLQDLERTLRVYGRGDRPST